MRAVEFSFNVIARVKLKQSGADLAFDLFTFFAVIKVKVFGCS